MRTTSKTGLDLIKSFEGFVGHAYKPVSAEPFFTIGFGHYGRDVKATDTITKARAEELLKSDLKVYEAKVNIFDNDYKWTQNEFDALVSFCYNVGSIVQLTQNGTRSKKQIAEAMTRYVKDVSGNTLQGLVRRRKAEKELFLKNDNVSHETFNYTESTTIKEIVDDIIAGKYGNNENRRDNVYKVIQGFVNKRFS